MSAMCKICEKFSSQFNLNKHLKNVHENKPVAASYKKSVWSYKCEEPSCNSSFYRNQGLIDRLLMCHNIEVESETRQFKTLQDFREWKGDIEKATICNYVRLRGKKTSEIQHIHLSRADRNAVASKLAAGVPKER
ncbi:hypothetical protein NQ314_021080 [Rhamnusium bicolor]|uniref:C2H2-type domain-containing protein n=1 Tax=Rhamnusium bicolor TaxID=1586634 RepID=A0AAV8WJY9_9CUCU|nr:hypothetical protein NQ314_021080 [Rhamnusium bicolor]